MFTSILHMVNHRKDEKHVYFDMLGYDIETNAKHSQELSSKATHEKRMGNEDGEGILPMMRKTGTY